MRHMVALISCIPRVLPHGRRRARTRAGRGRVLPKGVGLVCAAPHPQRVATCVILGQHAGHAGRKQHARGGRRGRARDQVPRAAVDAARRRPTPEVVAQTGLRLPAKDIDARVIAARARKHGVFFALGRPVLARRAEVERTREAHRPEVAENGGRVLAAWSVRGASLNKKTCVDEHASQKPETRDKAVAAP